MVKTNEHMSLEHATFRVPYEELNRKYRNGHKNIEKTVTKINKVGSAIRMKLANSQETVPVDSVKKLFSSLCQHVEEAQKAFTDVTTSEMDQINKFTDRINQLDQEMVQEDPSDEFDQRRVRTARQVVNYLLRCGHVESAKKLSEKYNLDSVVDIDVFEQIKLVHQSILDKSTKLCLEWIESHRSKLRRMNSPLELRIRQQDVIDLVNKNETTEALQYTKKFIFPITKTENPELLKMIMGIITLPPMITSKKYPQVMNDEVRWKAAASDFMETAYLLYQLPQQSIFSISLQSGLSAHKTPSCKCDPRPPKEVECCVCSSSAWPIAEGLPNSHVAVSRILCSKTGEPCDETNLPYLLPSGHVYGQKAIQSMRNGDFVTCPETGSLVNISDVHRLFFL